MAADRTPRPARRAPRARAAAAHVAHALAVATLLAAGIRCDGTTGDHRVRFSGTIRGSGRTGTTRLGWALAFERFVVALGPVRIYSDPPFAAARGLPRRARDRGARFDLLARVLRGPFRLGVAHAQHCHGCPRAPVAEFGFERGAAIERAVDLLEDSPFQLGPANARNGTYRSVSLSFRAPRAPLDAGVVGGMLAGRSMVVRGVAARDGLEVPFAGAIDLETPDARDPSAGGDDRPYTTFGVVFDSPRGVDVQSANESTDRVAVRVELARMFDQADFASLPPAATAGEPRAIETGSQVHAAWLLGAADPRTIRVGWVGAGGSGEPQPLSERLPLVDAGR